MYRQIFLFFFLAFSVLGIQAQIRGTNIMVQVQPNHADWNYKIGEKASFEVSVLKSGTPLVGAIISYEAGPVMFPTVTKEKVELKEGKMKWTGSMNTPGFYRLKVTAHVDGKTYEGLCTAAFSPEKVQPATHCPKDFDAFGKKHWLMLA